MKKKKNPTIHHKKQDFGILVNFHFSSPVSKFLSISSLCFLHHFLVFQTNNVADTNDSWG